MIERGELYCFFGHAVGKNTTMAQMVDGWMGMSGVRAGQVV